MPSVAYSTVDRRTPQPANLTPLANRGANETPDANRTPRACFGVACPYHSGCVAYARVETDPEATRIATCWIKGAFPLREVA